MTQTPQSSEPPSAPPSDDTVSETSSSKPPVSLLEQLLSGAEPSGNVLRREGQSGSETSGSGTSIRAAVGVCLEDRHPVLQGRVLVQVGGGPESPSPDSRPTPSAPDASIDADVHPTRSWLPVLRGISVRRRDHLLLIHPHGWEEAVVVGVIDGFRRRDEVPVEGGPALELKGDEALTIRDREGTPILRVREGTDGPEIQLLSEASRIRLPGALDISASQIRIEARDGGVVIEANDDVEVRGEVIRLN